jgi:hypothetical protein
VRPLNRSCAPRGRGLASARGASSIIARFFPEHASRLVHDHAVEQRLERDDHAMVHCFAAAEIT